MPSTIEEVLEKYRVRFNNIQHYKEMSGIYGNEELEKYMRECREEIDKIEEKGFVRLGGESFRIKYLLEEIELCRFAIKYISVKQESVL